MTSTKDTMNNSELNQLMEELKYKMQVLKEYGLSEKEIISSLHSGHPLPQLIITRNYKILLGEERKEIHLEPLVKSVYLLFLKHPEGIIFKDLPDHREELAHIYNKVRPLGLTERALKSLEDVTNPMLNSINEKCARIRGAFLGEFDDYMAKYYYIEGKRGEAKKISLPRDLVTWE